MIPAILLAAGSSQRMRAPKALLPFKGTTFLRHLIDVLTVSRASPIVVVLGPDAAPLRTELAGTDVHVVVNEESSSGQLSSIRAGIRAVRPWKPDALLLQPTDHPLVTASVVNTLIERFLTTSAPVVVPVVRGKRGHPVIFSRGVFDELLTAPEGTGARAVVWGHAAEIEEVAVDDEGICFDVDTPEDYERLQAYLRADPRQDE